MTMSFICPVCGRTINGPEEAQGKIATCPACRSRIQLGSLDVQCVDPDSCRPPVPPAAARFQFDPDENTDHCRRRDARPGPARLLLLCALGIVLLATGLFFGLRLSSMKTDRDAATVTANQIPRKAPPIEPKHLDKPASKAKAQLAVGDDEAIASRKKAEEEEAKVKELYRRHGHNFLKWGNKIWLVPNRKGLGFFGTVISAADDYNFVGKLMPKDDVFRNETWWVVTKEPDKIFQRAQGAPVALDGFIEIGRKTYGNQLGGEITVPLAVEVSLTSDISWDDFRSWYRPGKDLGPSK